MSLVRNGYLRLDAAAALLVAGLVGGAALESRILASRASERVEAPEPAPAEGRAPARRELARGADPEPTSRRARRFDDGDAGPPRARKAEATTAPDAPRPAVAAAAVTPAADAPPGSARRRAADLQAEADDALRQKDGKRALALLKDLLALGEDGDAAAIEVARRIASDLNADRRIGVTGIDFDKAMRSDDMIPVLKRALLDPTADPRFRARAIEDLAYTSNADTTPFVLSLLDQERDPWVVGRMTSFLSDQTDPAIGPALARAFASAQDPRERMQLLDALTGFPGDDTDRALAQAAAGDADPEVRRMAQLAATARNPPAEGYLLTGVADRSAASQAGLQAGDILLTYNGVPMGPDTDLSSERDKVPKGATVAVTVYRDGQTMQVTMPAGRLGVNGKGVTPR